MTRFLAPAILFLCLPVAMLAAPPPDAATVAKRMTDSLQPPRPSVRRLDVVVIGKLGESRWTTEQARKRRADGDWILNVVLAPEGDRGSAVVMQRTERGEEREWVYLPSVRRVREIVPVDRYQTYLYSDFTLADLGFVGYASSYKLVGTETLDGVETVKLEETPADSWYVSRIVDWVATDTWLPRKREIFAPSGESWKVERFEDVRRVDGTPTAFRIVMDDVRQKTSSRIELAEVRYDVDVPDTVFEPGNLPEAAASPLWSSGR